MCKLWVWWDFFGISVMLSGNWWFWSCSGRRWILLSWLWWVIGWSWCFEWGNVMVVGKMCDMCVFVVWDLNCICCEVECWCLSLNGCLCYFGKFCWFIFYLILFVLSCLIFFICCCVSFGSWFVILIISVLVSVSVGMLVCSIVKGWFWMCSMIFVNLLIGECYLLVISRICVLSWCVVCVKWMLFFW